MSKSIRLSEKHGVNPCIPVCAFCGKQKQELAFLGRLPGDIKAPMSAVLNYEPCDECRQNWSMGVPLIRVSKTPGSEGQPPIQKREGFNIYPTGSYMVITKEAAERIFEHEIQAGKPVFMEDKAYDDFYETAQKAEKE